jgi:hypothetical protein
MKGLRSMTTNKFPKITKKFVGMIIFVFDYLAWVFLEELVYWHLEK